MHEVETPVMEKLRRQSDLLKNCYDDADLGALLRSEPFRDFREKFPEPKDKPARGSRDADEP